MIILKPVKKNEELELAGGDRHRPEMNSNLAYISVLLLTIFFCSEVIRCCMLLNVKNLK